MRRLRTRLFFTTVVGAAAALALTACMGIAVPDHALAGSWQSAPGPDGRRAVLVMSADGSFHACNIPFPILQAGISDYANWDRTIDGAGTWARSTDFDGLEMAVTTARHGSVTDTGIYFGSRLYIGEDFGGLRLYDYLGDPDSGRTFTFRRTTGISCDLPSD